jgi:hypothetical protein
MSDRQQRMLAAASLELQSSMRHVLPKMLGELFSQQQWEQVESALMADFSQRFMRSPHVAELAGEGDIRSRGKINMDGVIAEVEKEIEANEANGPERGKLIHLCSYLKNAKSNIDVLRKRR